MKLIDMTPEQREIAQAFYRTRYAAEKKYQAAYREQNREKECARVAAWRARKATQRRAAEEAAVTDATPREGAAM